MWMTRPRKRYNPDVKAKIYTPLTKGKLGFEEWRKASRIDRFTFNDYRRNGLDTGEIDKEPGGRGKYFLTSIGQVELDRIVEEHKLRSQPVRYRGSFDSSNELDSLLYSTLEPPPDKYELPLPIPVQATLYGSKQLPLMEFAEHVLAGKIVWRDENGRELPQERLSSKKAQEEFLKVMTELVVKQFVWRAIWDQAGRMAELQRAFTRGETKLPAPPVNLDSLLGFDLTLTIRYEGKKSMTAKLGEIQKQQQIHKIGNRLTGALLLSLGTGSSVIQSKDLIHLLRRGDLIKGEDADGIMEVIPKNGGTLNDVAKKLILRTAFRYLREGGILAEENDSESLVARFT
jgi:hypothetical protein